MKIAARANAKVNLFLELTGKRSDGYHALDSLFQSVSLCDTVTVGSELSGIALSCSDTSLACDESNIAHKAARLFFEASQIKGGCSIHIDKKIPVQAGMGGGSADGAAVLVLLNEIYGKPLELQQLVSLSASVGADLPFCIMGGTRFATGIGELLSDPLPLPVFYLSVLKPDSGIPTGRAFSALDRLNADFAPGAFKRSFADINALLFSEDKTGAVKSVMYNRFEEILPELCPECVDIINNVRRIAGSGLLSGSGSAIFSVHSSHEEAEAVSAGLGRLYPGFFRCVCESRPLGVEILSVIR